MIITRPNASQTVMNLGSGGGNTTEYVCIRGLEITGGALRFNGQVVAPDEDSIELPDGTVLPRLVSGQSFWFAWAGNHPDTTWWPTT